MTHSDVLSSFAKRRQVAKLTEVAGDVKFSSG